MFEEKNRTQPTCSFDDGWGMECEKEVPFSFSGAGSINTIDLKKKDLKRSRLAPLMVTARRTYFSSHAFVDPDSRLKSTRLIKCKKNGRRRLAPSITVWASFLEE
jgi:hypothetical protein